MIDFRNDLSDIQFQAVTYVDGPELVIAGAGSGKTRVLTYKIAYLLERGIRPNRVLALTFTNKAAKEMKARIASLVSSDSASKILMGTFHSIFARILRFEVDYNKDLLPYTNKFTIYDTGDSSSVIKEIVEKMQLDPKKFEPSVVARRISAAKNSMLRPDQYAISSMYKDDKENGLDKIYDVYKKYNLALVKSNAMDFDDLLLNVHYLFQEKDNVRKKYANHFMYCLVDEYQDTNLIQKEILLQLTKERNMICAVGDDAQSIYSFRGAVIGNILNFNDDFPGAVTFKLEENYRSTRTIVSAANSVIKKNKCQIAKNLFSNNKCGEPISVFRGHSDREEVRYVSTVIKDMVNDDNRPYDDFAILYRSNWLSRSFEDEFRRADIPYKIFGGTSFYQRKEVKDLMAYFRVVVNPDDEQALRRIINYPSRGIGSTTLSKIVDISILCNKSLWEVISRPNYLNALPKGTVKKILDFAHLVRGWKNCLSEDAYTIACRICKESGMGTLFSAFSKPEDSDRFDNIQQVLTGIKEFVDDHRKVEGSPVSLEEYIREVSLLTDEEETGNSSTVPRVKLMTVHASKGLEFPIVFVVGMDEGIFPCRQAFDSYRSLEEERRLFYVAITRTKELCHLTGADNRFRNGNNIRCEESGFVGDIDSQFIKEL